VNKENIIKGGTARRKCFGKKRVHFFTEDKGEANLAAERERERKKKKCFIGKSFWLIIILLDVAFLEKKTKVGHVEQRGESEVNWAFLSHFKLRYMFRRLTNNLGQSLGFLLKNIFKVNLTQNNFS
jgi:hypothetical protein